MLTAIATIVMGCDFWFSGYCICNGLSNQARRWGSFAHNFIMHTMNLSRGWKSG